MFAIALDEPFWRSLFEGRSVVCMEVGACVKSKDGAEYIMQAIAREVLGQHDQLLGVVYIHAA